jgi:hypothetical protein
MFIIASFLLSMSGCGYKANPYIEQEPPAEDENVKFVIEKKEFPVVENNVSCE